MLVGYLLFKFYKMGLLVLTYNPSNNQHCNPTIKEIYIAESFQCHPWLQSKFEAILGYVRDPVSEY